MQNHIIFCKPTLFFGNAVNHLLIHDIISGDGKTHPSQFDPDHPQVHSARFYSTLKTTVRKTIGTLHVGEKRFSMMVKGRIAHYICAADGEFVEVEDEGEGAGEVEAAQDPSTEA